MSLKLWENLEQDFNYNAMVSQRSILNLFHSDAQRDAFVRRGNAMMLAGADAELPMPISCAPSCRFWISTTPAFRSRAGCSSGAAARCGTTRWRGAMPAGRTRGVDIIQNCEVTGFDIEGGVAPACKPRAGAIRAKKVAVCVAGSSGRVMEKAGMRLPIESHVLQAFVTEGLKPVFRGL